MSRIGKQPVPVPSGVSVTINGASDIVVKGPKGELAQKFPAGVKIVQEDDSLVITRDSDLKAHRAYHGLTRALVANMVHGVSEGFKKNLELVGIGYTAEQQDNDIVLNLGYSHPIYMQAAEGIKFEVTNRNTNIEVSGIDRQLVGQVAAKIRSLRKPEPYKGKGVRYAGEHVQRKAGKTVGGAG